MGQIGARQLAALTLALQAHARKHVQILLAAARAARAYALSHSCQIGMKVGAHGGGSCAGKPKRHDTVFSVWFTVAVWSWLYRPHVAGIWAHDAVT